VIGPLKLLARLKVLALGGNTLEIVHVILETRKSITSWQCIVDKTVYQFLVWFVLGNLARILISIASLGCSCSVPLNP